MQASRVYMALTSTVYITIGDHQTNRSAIVINALLVSRAYIHLAREPCALNGGPTDDRQPIRLNKYHTYPFISFFFH